jgi:hypothetical protein
LLQYRTRSGASKKLVHAVLRQIRLCPKESVVVAVGCRSSANHRIRRGGRQRLSTSRRRHRRFLKPTTNGSNGIERRTAEEQVPRLRSGRQLLHGTLPTRCPCSSPSYPFASQRICCCCAVSCRSSANHRILRGGRQRLSTSRRRHRRFWKPTQTDRTELNGAQRKSRSLGFARDDNIGGEFCRRRVRAVLRHIRLCPKESVVVAP